MSIDNPYVNDQTPLPIPKWLKVKDKSNAPTQKNQKTKNKYPK